MNKATVLVHEFVEFIPDELKEGTIYVSIKYATAAHKCCCGCGKEVVTPLTPTDWELTFDGESISLSPSIGNWSFDCKSHYWIVRNKVKWARRWSQKEIELGRSRDRSAKENYYDSTRTPTVSGTNASTVRPAEVESEGSIWRKLKKWWF